MMEMEKGVTKPNQKQGSAGFIKNETVMFIGLACLFVGFLLGIAFSAFKTPTGDYKIKTNGQKERISADQSRQIINLEVEVQKNPENVEAWTKLGHLYFDTDQPEKAINAYNKSLALSPGNPDVITDLGVMYRRAGKPDMAIASFDKAIAINAKHDTARFNKGVVLIYDLNDKAGGLAAWQELVAINPMATAPNGQMVSEVIKEIQQQ